MRPYDLTCEIPSEPSVAPFRIISDRQILRHDPSTNFNRHLKGRAVRDGFPARAVGNSHGQLRRWRQMRCSCHRLSRFCHICNSPSDTRMVSTALNSLCHLPFPILPTLHHSDGTFSCYNRHCRKTQIDPGRYTTPCTHRCIRACPTTYSYR